MLNTPAYQLLEQTCFTAIAKPIENMGLQRLDMWNIM